MYIWNIKNSEVPERNLGKTYVLIHDVGWNLTYKDHTNRIQWRSLDTIDHIEVSTYIKVEALVVNHLSDVGADGEEYEVMEFFLM